MERLCFTIVLIMICWEIERERKKKKLDEDYGKSDIDMKRMVMCMVRYWVIWISQVYSYQGSFSTSSARVVSKLGQKLSIKVSRVPRTLIWQGPLIELYYLNSDGALQGGFISGGVIKRWDGEHMSNFFSLYRKGSNTYAKIKVCWMACPTANSSG